MQGLSRKDLKQPALTRGYFDLTLHVITMMRKAEAEHEIWNTKMGHKYTELRRE